MLQTLLKAEKPIHGVLAAQLLGMVGLKVPTSLEAQAIYATMICTLAYLLRTPSTLTGSLGTDGSAAQASGRECEQGAIGGLVIKHSCTVLALSSCQRECGRHGLVLRAICTEPSCPT